jgi:hypothetical protein
MLRTAQVILVVGIHKYSNLHECVFKHEIYENPISIRYFGIEDYVDEGRQSLRGCEKTVRLETILADLRREINKIIRSKSFHIPRPVVALELEFARMLYNNTESLKALKRQLNCNYIIIIGRKIDRISEDELKFLHSQNLFIAGLDRKGNRLDYSNNDQKDITLCTDLTSNDSAEIVYEQCEQLVYTLAQLVNSNTDKSSYTSFLQSFDLSIQSNKNVSTFQISDFEVASIISVFSETRDVGNRMVSPHYAGNPRIPFSDKILTVHLDTTKKKILTEFLLSNRFRSEICSALEIPRFAVLNCRPVVALPHKTEGSGPQAWHLDHNPTGIFRAIVYLNDVYDDTGPFAYLPIGASCEEDQVLVTGRRGTVIVFDANAVRHRATPPINGARYALDIVLTVCTEKEEQIVNFVDMNNWPCNRFYIYRVSTMSNQP